MRLQNLTAKLFTLEHRIRAITEAPEKDTSQGLSVEELENRLSGNEALFQLILIAEGVDEVEIKNYQKPSKEGDKLTDPILDDIEYRLEIIEANLENVEVKLKSFLGK